MSVSIGIKGRFDGMSDDHLMYHSRSGVTAWVSKVSDGLRFVITSAVYCMKRKRFIDLREEPLTSECAIFNQKELNSIGIAKSRELKAMVEDLRDAFVKSIGSDDNIDVLMKYAASHLTRDEMIAAIRFRIFSSILQGEKDEELNVWIGKLNELL